MHGGSAMDLFAGSSSGDHDRGSCSRSVGEVELLREIVSAFQGHNGKILVQDPHDDNRYTIVSGYTMDPSDRQLALRLCNLGWLFSRVNSFCTEVNRDPTSRGFLFQSFASALQEEIREYYR